jgi:hypothetical protein
VFEERLVWGVCESPHECAGVCESTARPVARNPSALAPRSVGISTTIRRLRTPSTNSRGGTDGLRPGGAGRPSTCLSKELLARTSCEMNVRLERRWLDSSLQPRPLPPDDARQQAA